MLENRENDLNLMINGIINSLYFQNCEVKQYLQGEAIIVHPLIHMPLSTELGRLLEEKSIYESKYISIYEIVYGDGSSFAIKCCNGNMTLGVGIEKSI